MAHQDSIDVRFQALSFALQGVRDNNPKAIIEAAQEYLAFLRGQPSEDKAEY